MSPTENNIDFLDLHSSIYKEITEYRNDNEALKTCITDTVEALLNQENVEGELNKPVCLLGKIQSGKTRAFIGVIAKAFDEGVNCTGRRLSDSDPTTYY